MEELTKVLYNTTELIHRIKFIKDLNKMYCTEVHNKDIAKIYDTANDLLKEAINLIRSEKEKYHGTI